MPLLVPEINRGQLRRVLRAEFLVDAAGLNRVCGLPLPVSEIRAAIDHMLGLREASPEGAGFDVRNVSPRGSPEGAGGG